MAQTPYQVAAATLAALLLAASGPAAGQTFYRSSPPPFERMQNAELVDGTLRRVPHIARLLGPWSCAASLLSPEFDAAGEVTWTARTWPVPGMAEAPETRPNWAVTAAHCVVNLVSGRPLPATLLTLRLGVLDLSSSRGITVGVEEVVLAGEDGRFRLTPGAPIEDDIALLRLGPPLAPVTDPADYDYAPRSIAVMPPRTDLWSPYASAFAAGWGATGLEDSSPQLLEARLPVVDAQTCAAGLRVTAPTQAAPGPDTLCAGYSTGDLDSCSGDSGGPLFYRPPPDQVGIVEQPVLIGIVSWGPDRAAGPGNYGVYTSVASHAAWMASVVFPNHN